MTNTPKPQANGLDEILETLLYGHGAVETHEPTYTTAKQQIQALKTEARANERQAMLNALPKKMKARFQDDNGGQQFASGHSFAIDQMKKTIKKMGGSDEHISNKQK